MEIRVLGFNNKATAFDQVAHLITESPTQLEMLFLLPDHFSRRVGFGELPPFLECLA